MADGRRVPDSGDGARPPEAESEAARLARNWDELLSELRVAQAGVQILFAFLLTLPFSARWDAVNAFQRGVYLATLLLVALASALLIGPVAYHRMVFRRQAKPMLVDAANTMAMGGLVALGLAVNLAVLLVVDVVVGGLATGLIVVGTASVFGWLWLLMPALARRRRTRRRDL
jgi:hypothetical protein